MKILSVVGARPNFVKIAPLMAEMRKHSGIQALLVHTGQHYDLEMSDFFFQDLGIPQPDINLEVGSASAARQIAQIIERLEPVLESERPDLVVVVGDVNSTLAGALAAVKLGIRVGHVEAGLRSFDRTMPEEINRVLTDAISDFLFVSELSGVENLLKEARPASRIFLVGNIMIDTLMSFLARARQLEPSEDREIWGGKHSDRPPRFALVTLHRPSTVDNPGLLRTVWQALEEIGSAIPMVFPVHPRTRQRLQDLGLDASPMAPPFAPANRIRLIAPLSYLRFLHLESMATFVITDSGGIQEETTVLGVPCLTVRENTERPITLTEGTNTLVGLDPERLKQEARRYCAAKRNKAELPPYGMGTRPTASLRSSSGSCQRWHVLLEGRSPISCKGTASRLPEIAKLEGLFHLLFVICHLPFEILESLSATAQNLQAGPTEERAAIRDCDRCEDLRRYVDGPADPGGSTKRTEEHGRPSP